MCKNTTVLVQGGFPFQVLIVGHLSKDDVSIADWPGSVVQVQDAVSSKETGPVRTTIQLFCQINYLGSFCLTNYLGFLSDQLFIFLSDQLFRLIFFLTIFSGHAGHGPQISFDI